VLKSLLAGRLRLLRVFERMRVATPILYFSLWGLLMLLGCPEPNDGPQPPPKPPAQNVVALDAGGRVLPPDKDGGAPIFIADAGLGEPQKADAAVPTETIDAGQNEPIPPPESDAGVETIPPDDAGITPPLIFTGQTFDLANGSWLTGVTASTYGHDPFLVTASEAEGHFEMEVNAGGLFFLRTSWPGYRTTFSPIAIQNVSVSQNIPMVSNDLVTQWSTDTGTVQSNACGLVLLQVLDGGGEGLAGVGPVTLSDAVDASGPFYLDNDHQVLIDATGTSEAGYVLFMNVCTAGSNLISTQTSFTRTIEIEGDTEERILSMHTATVLFEKMMVGEAPPPPPPPENLIDFATEIHPLFESLYCANCHRANSPLPNIQLELDGTPDAVYEALLGGDAPRVDLNVPDDSLLLKKPLLEDPPDHPNAAFIATNDPAYVLIRSWIEQGAPFEGSVFVDPPEPLRFAEDIMPIFQVGGSGRGCASCHSGTLPSGGLGLAGAPDAVYDHLVAGALLDLTTPVNSPLLQVPASSDLQIHPTRVFYSEDDPDFQRILTWIADGAVHEENSDGGL